jgi:spore coat polysaccharide biosynthesis protein SpsF (cytidylyltransferase family)
MMPLAGRSVLAHVLERCHAVDGVESVCCATTDTSECDIVADEARQCGAEVFRGSEEDVLERHFLAARELRADVILRVTSDSPLIDPKVCRQVLLLQDESGADYACNNGTPPTWPMGLGCEVTTYEWLERAQRYTQRPSEREHPTLFVKNHPEAKLVNLECPEKNIAHHWWALDSLADYRLLDLIFDRLPDGSISWDYHVPLDIVEADPPLASINNGQDRFASLAKAFANDKEHGFAPNDPRS